MSPRKFEGLPLLPPGVHAISELHVLLCDPPRPVAVQTRRGYHLLPETLWSVAEVVARAAQDLEVEQVPSCSIYRFLLQLLGQAVVKRGVLQELRNKHSGQGSSDSVANKCTATGEQDSCL